MGNGKWIWPKQAGGSTAPLFCVAELCREYQFEKEMELVSVRVTADTFFAFISMKDWLGVMPYPFISTFPVSRVL